MIKRGLVYYGVAAIINVMICWIIALNIQPSPLTDGTPLEQSEVIEQLAFTFDDQLAWQRAAPFEPSGEMRRRALVRQLSVTGWSTAPTPIRYSEQIMKVGWPFTTVRGFIRTEGKVTRYEGAIPLQSVTTSGTSLRILPTQIVWPGILINSGLLALLPGLVQLLIKR